jgi:transcriptional regulator with XRE-family HTH domain
MIISQDKALANVVREAIKLSGRSQMEFAQSIGITYPMLTKLTSGSSRFTLPRLRQIASELGVHPSELLKEAGQ